MIALVEGRLASLSGDHVVIVASGVGYKIFTPAHSISAAVGDAVMLHTSLVVREDSMTLYGFGTPNERDLFEKLITVSGIGPKTGLAILGTLTIDHLRNAVASGQPEVLMRVPSIGRKSAEKILLELKDKLKGADGLIAPGVIYTDVNRDVQDALTALGYSIAEAQAALSSLPPDTPNNFDERLRRALQYFI